MTLTIKWVGPPRSYTEGRARQLRYVTLHYTAGSEGPTSAENGAAYDRKRTDGTSCHYFVDSLGPALQEVHDEDTSHSAYPKGNALGIHIELCGTAQTRAQWLDATSRATLQTAAELVAYLLKKHNLPNKRLSVAETRAAWYADAADRSKYEGYNDHGTVTRAYPEDGGTHTDLGAGFPWDVFSEMITEAMGDPVTPAEMKTLTGMIVKALTTDKAFLAAVGAGVWNSDVVPAPAPPVNNPDWMPDPSKPTEGNRTWAGKNALHDAMQVGRENAARLLDGVEVQALVGLTPEAQQALAEAVADELHARTES